MRDYSWRVYQLPARKGRYAAADVATAIARFTSWYGVPPVRAVISSRTVLDDDALVERVEGLAVGLLFLGPL